MMAAMMLPGAAPAVARRARMSGKVRSVLPFAGSYLAVWALVGAGVYAVYGSARVPARFSRLADKSPGRQRWAGQGGVPACGGQAGTPRGKRPYTRGKRQAPRVRYTHSQA